MLSSLHLVHFSVMSDSLWPHGLQHTRIPCPSPTHGAYLNSCPSSWWCHPTIPLSSCLQSFPASGSFPVSQLFTSDGQSIEASASVSVFPVNIQGWFPLRVTGLISLQSKGLSRIFSNTTIKSINSSTVLYSSDIFAIFPTIPLERTPQTIERMSKYRTKPEDTTPIALSLIWTISI